MKLRKMTEADIPAVTALETVCFSDPWTERMVRDLLTGVYDACFVLEEDGQTAGYINIRVLGDEAELMRICIAPALRGRGLSRPLLKRGMQEMAARGAASATLEVRRGNAAAVHLYETHGFALEGYRKNYYTGPAEDAGIYWNRNLSETLKGMENA